MRKYETQKGFMYGTQVKVKLQGLSLPSEIARAILLKNARSFYKPNIWKAAKKIGNFTERFAQSKTKE